jgi:hypothetical protein
MKITRKTLLIITAAIGGILIVYSAVRMILKRDLLPPEYEKWFMDGIIFAALGIFMYNRKMARDEKKAREAAAKAEEEQQRAPVEDDDDGRPHWERSSAENGEGA